MAVPYRIHTARPADVAGVVAVEQASFSEPWSPDAFATGPGDIFLVATVQSEVIGFALGRVVSDEGDVLNLAVHPARRGAGVGRALLAALLAAMRREGAETAYLDVRESNRVAIDMYRRCGFEIVGSRTGYYTRPAEDALQMRRVFKAVTGLTKNDPKRRMFD